VPERRIQVPNLHNGMSTQPGHLRYPNQTGPAENVVCSVIDGTSTRAGTIQVATIDKLPDDGDIRLHPIVRDQFETYLLLYGDGVMRLWQIQPGSTASGECTLTIQPDAQLYLDQANAGADDLRCVSVQDYTFILNTATEAGATTADSYTVDKVTRDYDGVLSIVPVSTTTDPFYVRAETDTATEPAGHWQFDPALITSGLWGQAIYAAASDADWLKPNGNWTDATKNPSGFSVALGRRVLSSSSGSWAPGTKRLTITGAFAGYTPAADDEIYITGGTGVTTGWQPIFAKIDDDTIQLFNSIAAGSPTNVAVDGIGHYYRDVQIDLSGVVVQDLHDVAREIQTSLRVLGAADACVAWDPISLGFVITAAWRGLGSRVYPLVAPTSPIYDLTAATRPFNSPTYVAGTVSNPSDPLVPPSDRWIKKARPNDEEGRPDPLKMPVQLVRTSPGGLSYGPWTQAILDSDPWVAYNFNELGGRGSATVDNIVGIAARDGQVAVVGTGSYVIAPGTIAETGNEALYLSTGTIAANNAYVQVGGFDSGGLPVTLPITLGDGFTFEFVLYKSSGTSEIRGLSYITDPAGLTKCGLELAIGGGLSFTVLDADGNGLSWTKSGDVIPAGAWHHLVAVYDPTGATNADKMKVYLNGSLLTVTTFYAGVSVDTSFLSSLAMQVNPAFFGNPGITGWFDAFAFYTRPLSSTDVAAHYAAIPLTGGSSSSFSEFEIDTVDWNERTSGSKITNPLPSLITEGRKIADIGLHRNRLVLAGDGYVTLSAADDLFNFYLEDFDNLVDSDPIDLPIGSNEVAIIQHVLPWQTTLLVFTKGGRQFQMNAPEALTPSTASLTPTTSEQTQETRPVLIGSTVQFVTDNGNNSALVEYVSNEQGTTNVPAKLSEHVEDLIPASIRTIAAHGGLGFTIMLPQTDDGDTLYVHRSWFVNQERVQSAWTRWTFDDVRIVDIAIVKDELWMLMETLDGWTLEYLELGKAETPSGFPYAPIVDRQVQATGVHSAGTTTWTFSTPDPDRNVIVLGSDFGANTGRTLTPTDVTDYTVECDGDWDAGPAISGRLIDASIELSRPYIRDQNGVARPHDTLTHMEIRVSHVNTGAYSVSSAMTGRAARSKQFSKAGYGIEESGTLRAFLNGDARTNTVTIASVDARPFTVVGIEHIMDHEPRPA
jgi:hypothetical protein